MLVGENLDLNQLIFLDKLKDSSAVAGNQVLRRIKEELEIQPEVETVSTSPVVSQPEAEASFSQMMSTNADSLASQSAKEKIDNKELYNNFLFRQLFLYHLL